jgi:ribosomal protein L16/L10AE
MIQTILLFTLRPGVTDEQIEALRAALARLIERRERCQIRI